MSIHIRSKTQYVSISAGSLKTRDENKSTLVKFSSAALWYILSNLRRLLVLLAKKDRSFELNLYIYNKTMTFADRVKKRC